MLSMGAMVKLHPLDGASLGAAGLRRQRYLPARPPRHPQQQNHCTTTARPMCAATAAAPPAVATSLIRQIQHDLRSKARRWGVPDPIPSISVLDVPCTSEAAPHAACAVTCMLLPARSALEITEQYLARLEATEPHVRAFITVAAEQARSEARTLDARLARDGDAASLGPLAGVPLGIKVLGAWLNQDNMHHPSS